MRLSELEPVWLSPDMFIFRNPTGRNAWLTCKRVPMSIDDQFSLVEKNPQYEWKTVVPSRPEIAWKFEGTDFTLLTVTPSIDASSSGNWHGFITNGEIVGGL